MTFFAHLMKLADGFLPYTFIDSMIMFFIYGFIGWIVEVIYYGVTEGKFINRGFLNGPHCPVYGLGFYGVIWFFSPLAHNFPVLFFGSAITATTVELLAGVILYWIFHLRWWDYTDYKFNFHGFICLRFSIYWGIACSLGVYMLHPTVMKLINFANGLTKYTVVSILSMILVLDIVVTVTSIFKFNERVRFISNISGGIRLVSDKLGTQIYDTVDTIVTKTSPAVETTTQSYAEFREMYSKHRDEEKALSKKHRAEERALLEGYVSIGRESINKTRHAAGQKITSMVDAVKVSGVRTLSTIRPGKKDDNYETLRYLQEQLEDVEQEENAKCV
ncbi:Uncharacterized membrane protein [Ruminococcaceae bacterium KH2T8]|nr:Uncharacterized membrane protein [Ruminococcaceae bacterium KH2T8]